MATVAVKGKNKGKNKSRMILKSSTGLKIKVQVAPRTVTVEQDGATWVDSPRPGRYPVMRLDAMKPKRMSMQFVIYSKDGSSVWPQLKEYILLARSAGAITILYSRNETGSWKITEFTYNIVNRNRNDNPTQVQINITFQRMSKGSLYTGPVKGLKKSPAPPEKGKDKKGSDSKTKNKARTHRVKKGDTLWDLANKYYGNPRKWTKIADANKVTNPRLLQIGTVLKIP